MACWERKREHRSFCAGFNAQRQLDDVLSDALLVGGVVGRPPENMLATLWVTGLDLTFCCGVEAIVS